MNCQQCGKQLHKSAKYHNTKLCRECYEGEPKISFCISCKKQLSKAGYYAKSKYCKSCDMIIRNTGKKLSQEIKDKIGTANKNKLSGDKNHKFVDGHTLYQHYCKCGNPISYDAKRCKLCYFKIHSELMKKLYKEGKVLTDRKYGKNHSRFGKRPEHGIGSYYKNIYMRSSYEIAFVKWCDNQNIRWQYEPKVFDLGNSTYTPDFYLPEFNLYIEVKGWWRDDAKAKFELFKQIYCGERIKIVNKLELQQIGVI